MYKNIDEIGVNPEENRDIYSVIEIASGQHKAEILGGHRVVCIDIYADWCGPCKMTAPTYALLAQNYSKPGICAVVKEKLDLKLSPGVQGIPCFHFFVNGNKVDEIVGADLDGVEEKLKHFVNASAETGANVLSRGPKSAIRHHRPDQPINQSHQQHMYGNQPMYAQMPPPQQQGYQQPMYGQGQQQYQPMYGQPNQQQYQPMYGQGPNQQQYMQPRQGQGPPGQPSPQQYQPMYGQGPSQGQQNPGPQPTIQYRQP